MRKLLSVLLATLMVLAVFPMAIPQTVTAVTGDRIAYLDPAGNDLTAALGDNSKPFATFNAAYDALCPEGGTIMFIAPYNVEQDAIMDLGIHYGEIVITADGDYDNYWFIARYVADVARYSQWTVKFGGPVTIENIALVEAGKTAAAVAGDIAEPSEYIFANFNPITIGEGVKCCSSSPIENADTSIAPQVDASSITELTTPTITNVSVSGGVLNINHGSDVVGTSSTAPNRLNQMKRDTCVTVNSGVWRAVAGGARHDATSVTTAYNGNYRVYINGGTIGEVIGTNWYSGSNHCGGQSYIYMTGGTVNNVHTGQQSIDNAPQRTSIFVWTGGKIKTDIIVRNSADTFVLYGGEVGLATASDKGVTKAYTGAPNITIDNAAGNADQRMLACDGQSCAVRPRNGSRVTVLPLASTEGQVVYVDQSNGNLNGLGTEDNAVNSYMVALAMFNLVGGKIVLKGDYTISNEDTTSLFAFREPDHCEVVVDGNNNSMSNVASSHNKVTVNSVEYTISAGLDNYILSGDTTFQNVKFDFVNAMNFSADFNKLVMGEGVSRGEQAVYVLGANYYPTGREGNGNTYNVVYRPQYANHSDADTYITIKSGNFWVSGFSRVLHGDKPFHYGGTAHINIEGGTISHLYPTPTNSTVATAAAAEINISGGVVNSVYTGGHAKGYGTLASLTYNISDDAVIGAFNVIDNCTGTATYNITNNYLTYKKAADAFAAATVTDVNINTDIDDIAFNLEEYGAKYVGPENYGLRAIFAIDSSYFEENADFYNVVEMGVLVKASANENALTYIKGKDFYPTSLEAVENTENYDPETKIAKSIVYVKGADINNYKYAGPEAADTTVYFSAPITQLTAAHGETMFTFMPYVVVADADDGEHMVVYGDAYEQNLYLVVYALAEGIESEEDCTDDATRAAYNILVDINGYINSEE